MVYVIFWIVLSLIIGFLGSKKNIGFAGAFILSLLLSPLIGLIIVLASGDKESARNQAISGMVHYGDKYFEKGKYEEAINKYLRVTELPGISPNTHFKLAKIYAIKENKELSIKHLNTAFEQGFKSYSRLQDGDFCYLRNQPEYKRFVENGYKLVTENNAKKTGSLEKMDALEKLSKLHKDGVLTDEEFQKQKTIILGN
ncbi:tetratricopeptide repeat protein [Bacteroidota bacterium]